MSSLEEILEIAKNEYIYQYSIEYTKQYVDYLTQILNDNTIIKTHSEFTELCDYIIEVENSIPHYHY